MKTIGITGGSGFIGSYVTKMFLEKDYKVKISVTDIDKKDKYQHLMKFDNSDNLEITTLNVSEITQLKEFATDCEILVHCGTPFQLEFEDPQKEIFDPTVKGTENLLRVISDIPSIKKVVFIASVAAYNTGYPMPVVNKSADHIYTEEDTPFIDNESHPYNQAKYYADQAVRKFIADNPDLGFEITSVFPMLVVGSPLSSRQDSTSVGLQFLIKNKMAPNPLMEMFFEHNIEFALVGVEDVAESIYKAATINGLHGKNYLLSSDSWRISDISLLLNNKSPEVNSRTVYSNKLATNDLGMKFKPSKLSLNQYG